MHHDFRGGSLRRRPVRRIDHRQTHNLVALGASPGHAVITGIEDSAAEEKRDALPRRHRPPHRRQTRQRRKERRGCDVHADRARVMIHVAVNERRHRLRRRRRRAVVPLQGIIGGISSSSSSAAAAAAVVTVPFFDSCPG